MSCRPRFRFHAEAGVTVGRVQAPRGRLRVSAVDGGHLRFFVALAGGRGEVVQPFDLLGAQLELVGSGAVAGHRFKNRIRGPRGRAPTRAP